MQRFYRKNIVADAVLTTQSVTHVEVSRVVTFPNVIDLSIIGHDNYICAHLSREQAVVVITLLAESLAAELST